MKAALALSYTWGTLFIYSISLPSMQLRALLAALDASMKLFYLSSITLRLLKLMAWLIALLSSSSGESACVAAATPSTWLAGSTPSPVAFAAAASVWPCS